MKLKTVFEDDLAARRQAKQAEVEHQKRQPLLDVMDDLTVTVSGAIDHLIEKGMSEDEAKKRVMKHLSDIVMAHDIM
jgi:polyhydroxyalkanoate synthesis regulator phasin